MRNGCIAGHGVTNTGGTSGSVDGGSVGAHNGVAVVSVVGDNVGAHDGDVVGGHVGRCAQWCGIVRVLCWAATALQARRRSHHSIRDGGRR